MSRGRVDHITAATDVQNRLGRVWLQFVPGCPGPSHSHRQHRTRIGRVWLKVVSSCRMFAFTTVFFYIIGEQIDPTQVTRIPLVYHDIVT